MFEALASIRGNSDSAAIANRLFCMRMHLRWVACSSLSFSVPQSGIVRNIYEIQLLNLFLIAHTTMLTKNNKIQMFAVAQRV